MGTLIFLILHLSRQLNSQYDCYLLSLLVSLDAQTLLRWYLWRRTL